MKKIFLISFLVLFLFLVLVEFSFAQTGCPTEGLVPCGTPGCPCQFCHIFVLLNNIIKFVMFKLVLVVAALMLIVGGIMYFFAGASPQALSQAKSIVTSVAIGLAIIFCAWVIINTVLIQSGIVKAEAVLKWYEISCGEGGGTPPPKGNTSPIAEAGPNKEVDEGGKSITLNGSGSDPDGDPMNYSWSCNGGSVSPSSGTVSSSGEATTTYTSPTDILEDTNYKCTLTVEDNKGAKDTDDIIITVKNIVIGGNHPPVADADGPYVGDPENLTIIFDGSDSHDPDGDTLTYQWDFGDGNQGTEVKPSHTYPDETKKYTVKLTVRDGKAESVDETEVRITGSAPLTPF